MSDRVEGRPRNFNILINAGILFVLVSASAVAGMVMGPEQPQGMTVVATVKKN
ncbi:hypothetical protein IZ6_10330 [Terrihabitans soli]|uniref:Uncharacterized protein n=1 Tax=Terrihabitans soli TaxID=708113 RepID=A0A6S6QUW3_9HYPH|nr:hypothetical protein [Terrihabitans soli]BCJ90298.1 hypothetical protein IZ6_10330 [Terrihabitans soli]